jgi:type III pantothenate kinase
MMNVVIDQGNSAAKIGIFDNHALREQYNVRNLQDIPAILGNFYGANLIISSVSKTHYADFPAGTFGTTINLSNETSLPIANGYQSPETLGPDRIAAACGAWHLFPARNSLVIDAGTCITYEMVESGGIYLGGGISPGLAMRFKAMHTFTARLPLVTPVDTPELIGTTTTACMQSGVIWGMIEEIDGVVARYREKYPDLQVILCGGDAPFFENKLKASIFASPEIVLIGLNSILSHNVNL